MKWDQALRERALRVARRRFGCTLAVMPTGSGKSAVYQIPAVMMNGPTVVVSPLIALQRDQLQSLEEQDVAPAAVVNSLVRESEKREAFDDLEEGGLEFMFLAPEQFNNDACETGRGRRGRRRRTGSRSGSRAAWCTKAR